MIIPEITSADFTREVLENPQPVLVDFYGTYCAPCRAMLPILEEVATERAGAVKCVKLNAHEDAPFAARYRVNAVPSFILFRSGEPIGQRTGAASKRDLLAWLDSTAV
jgi:thioredoxin 1